MYRRCPYCGVAEGEPIEEQVPIPSLRFEGEVQMMDMYVQVVREAEFIPAGDDELKCTECQKRFKFWDVVESDPKE